MTRILGGGSPCRAIGGLAAVAAVLALVACGSSADAPRPATAPRASPSLVASPASTHAVLASASSVPGELTGALGTLGSSWLGPIGAPPSVFVSPAAPAGPDAASPAPPGGSDLPPIACREQAPQPFLVRGHYVYRPDAGWEEAQRRKKRHRAAIEYRTRHYGYVDGFGEPTWNRHEPKDFTAAGRFFGIRVRMNRKVLVALGCVEQAIVRTCGAEAYVPEVLDGLRTRNTFHDGEVSNHTYGIALDVDPNKNSCCGCVWPLSDWPRCREPVSSPFERTGIPRCWVEAFERYGFYWLGNDALEDTMHFEFLGDPNKIK